MPTDIWIDLPPGGGTGLTSLNGLTGAVTLLAGAGITLTVLGQNITIASTGGIPASPNQSVQFNNSGAFGGSSNLTWTGTYLKALNLNTASGTGYYLGIAGGRNSLTLAASQLTLVHAGANSLEIAFDPSSMSNGFAVGRQAGLASYEIDNNGVNWLNGITECVNLSTQQLSVTNLGTTSANVNFGFNGASASYPVNILATQFSISPPAMVTVVSQPVDPSVIGLCTSGFDSSPMNQYNNNASACTSNGVCIGGSGGETDPVTCANDGGTWYYNTFTGTAGYTIPVNGTTITYNVWSHSPAAGGFFSATSTAGSYVTNFDTDPASIAANQNEGETGYTANGSSFTWIIYSIDSFGFRSQGSTFSTTDNNDGNPYAWDLTWATPTGFTPSQYYVYQVSGPNAGTAAYTSIPSITDDATWAAFVDPGLSTVSENVSWSAVGGADSYTLSSSLQGGFQNNLTGTSFVDYGTPYFTNMNPASNLGPKAGIALHVDGPSLLQNSLSSDPTLQVWAPTGGSYSQQWFDSSGNLKAYLDNTGTFTGNFNSISGNLTLGGTLSAGTVTTDNLQSRGGSSGFNWQPNFGGNQFLRIMNLPSTTLAQAPNAAIMHFDTEPPGSTVSTHFGGNITFRTSINPSPTFTPSGCLFSGMANNVSSSTYAGEVGMAVYDHSNTSTPIVFFNGASDGSGNVSLLLGAASTTAQHTLNTAVATNASGSGTFTNLPAGYSGNPTGYIQITINGGTHIIPYW